MSERLRIFDDREWRRVGHDVGDNSCFFMPATVVRRYRREGYACDLLDVVFDHRPLEVSQAHFADVTLPIGSKL